MRKLHGDQPTAALTWNKCEAAMGKCHCSKLLHVVQRLGAVIDFKARSPTEIRIGLNYIASHRGSDPFVKNIAFVGAKTIKSAQLHPGETGPQFRTSRNVLNMSCRSSWID